MPKLVRITTTPIYLDIILKDQIRFMQENGFDVTMISSDGPEVKKLVDREKCPHIAVHFTRKITPFKDLIALIKLSFILKKINPDIVHTDTPKAGLIGLWAAKLSGVPIRIHSIVGLPWVEYYGFLKKILILTEKLTAKAACKIYPNSFVQKDFLIKNNIATKKMQVLGNGSSNGIDIDFFSLTDELKKKAADLKKENEVPEKGTIWIFVGRVVKDKGITEILDAFVRIFESEPEDRLWIVGHEEPDLDPIDKNYRSILYNHIGIKYFGFQDDVRPFLAAADVLVFPSYREGFPNVPLQASLMDCTMILSDINGCNEIVENMKDGLLVPAKSTQALYEAMVYIRDNPEIAANFISSAKEKVIKKYDRKIIWKILLHEYRNLIKEKL